MRRGRTPGQSHVSGPRPGPNRRGLVSSGGIGSLRPRRVVDAVGEVIVPVSHGASLWQWLGHERFLVEDIDDAGAYSGGDEGVDEV